MPNDDQDSLIESEYDEPLPLIDFVAPVEAEDLLVEPETTTDVTQPRGYAPFDPTTLVTKQQDFSKPEPLLNDAGEVLPEFDPRYRDNFEGLLFLGSLQHTFDWMGHEFRIRTLLTDELLAVAVVTAAYKETLGNGLAYRIANAALCLVAVDGQQLPEPIERDPNNYEWAFQKFNYVKAKWFQFTIDAVYNEYLLLEQKVVEVIEALGKASRPTDSVPG